MHTVKKGFKRMANNNEIIGYMFWVPDWMGQELEVGKTYTPNEAYKDRFHTDRIYDGLYFTFGSPMKFSEYGAGWNSFFEENYNYFKVIVDKDDVHSGGGAKKSVSKVKILEKFTHDEIVDRQIEIAKNSPSFQKHTNEYEIIADANADANIMLSGRCSTVSTSGFGATVVVDECRSEEFSSGYVTFAASGRYSAVASLASYSSLAISGIYSFIETRGYGSVVAASGDYANVSIKSEGTNVAVSGDFSAIKSTAKKVTIAIAGSHSNSAVLGEDGVIAISGRWARFKGVKGTHVCVADYDEDEKFRGFVIGCIGENGLKENTFYTVENGRFIEASIVDEAAE